MQGLLDGMIAGYGIAVPVGAVSILIFTTGMASGFRSGFAAGAGAATADLVYAAAASAAGSALAMLLQPAARYLRVAGGVALLLLAGYGIVQGLRRRRRDPREGASSPGPAAPFATYIQLLGITLVNPLTVVYFAALILGRESGGRTFLVDRLAFIIGAAAASLSWQTLLAGLGSLLHGRLPDRFRVAAVVAGNLIVAALGARILALALGR
ncbi:MAG: LysE family transporter [Spirochaetia bacterium]|jgi:arginine exporter protein ArgO